MNHADARPFLEMVQRCFANYSKPTPPDDVLKHWLGKFAPYTIRQVAAAIDRHMSESRFAPVLADLLAFLPKIATDWPAANEAWSTALCSYDERDTVVWTREAQKAFESARAIYADGDKIGARMAFKESYERMVAEAKATGLTAVFFVSQGFDEARRKSAIENGRLRGLLTNEQSDEALLLTGPSNGDVPMDDETLAKNRSRVASLLELLKPKPKPKGRAPSIDPEIAATRARQSEQAQKVAEYAMTAGGGAGLTSN